MSIENIKNPEQNKEEIFQSWLAEFQGKFWLNSDAMPKGVYDAVQTYMHFNSHSSGKFFKVTESQDEKANKKMKEAAANFEKLTGYNIQDFIEYQDKQNQKLKTDKK